MIPTFGSGTRAPRRHRKRHAMSICQGAPEMSQGRCRPHDPRPGILAPGPARSATNHDGIASAGPGKPPSCPRARAAPIVLGADGSSPSSPRSRTFHDIRRHAHPGSGGQAPGEDTGAGRGPGLGAAGRPPSPCPPSRRHDPRGIDRSARAGFLPCITSARERLPAPAPARGQTHRASGSSLRRIATSSGAALPRGGAAPPARGMV
jgi:hypothetical protein